LGGISGWNKTMCNNGSRDIDSWPLPWKSGLALGKPPACHSLRGATEAPAIAVEIGGKPEAPEAYPTPDRHELKTGNSTLRIRSSSETGE